MFFFVVLLLASPIRCVEDRTRVLNGIPVKGRNTGYNAVRYYAAIATRHGIPKYKPPHSAHQAVLPWYLLLLKKKTVEGLFSCSGSLMTPQIIQTACHCLSTWQKTSSGYFRLPRINHHWENVVVVYIGVNRRFDTADSMEHVTPLESNRYFIHRDCAKYSEGSMTNQYDFGWIRVNTDWLSGRTGVPVHAVDFAPIYSAEGLKLIYQKALSKQLVCLRLGFGHWKLKANSNVQELSGVLRHGWGVVMTMAQCFRILAQNITYEYVAVHATWICASPFPKHNQSAGSGDSGGPITCDNLYVAVVSGSIKLIVYKEKTGEGKWKKATEPTGIYEPLYFAPYENALEYRKDFEDYIANFEGISYVDIIRKKFEDSLKGAATRNRIFHDRAHTPSTSNSNSFHHHQPSVCYVCVTILLLNLVLKPLVCNLIHNSIIKFLHK